MLKMLGINPGGKGLHKVYRVLKNLALCVLCKMGLVPAYFTEVSVRISL